MVFNWVTKFDYEHEYTYEGSTFIVQVQRDANLDTEGYEVWRYAILVRGNLLRSDTYKWPKTHRMITSKAAANHLATFWGPSDFIKDAQELEGSPEWELDEIVQKCVAFMRRYYMDYACDYDILVKHMDEDGWTVQLMPNLYNRNGPDDGYDVGILFYKKKSDPHVNVTTFERTRHLKTEL